MNRNFTGIINGEFMHNGAVICKVDELKSAGHPLYTTSVDWICEDLADDRCKGTIKYMVEAIDGDTITNFKKLKETAIENDWSITWTYAGQLSRQANFLLPNSCTRPMSPLVVITCTR